jgi:hypothetical protein
MTQAQVVHTTETITPELAQKYLDSNRLNRPLRDWRINLLAADMTAGNFPENGEAGVTFDWNGNIAGGQHTLNAVVRSGRTVRMRVTRGVDPTARTTMNDSMKQRFADDLGVAGVTNASNAEPLLRKAIVWETVAAANKGQGGLMEWRNTRMSRSALSAAWPTYAAGITATLAESTHWDGLWRGIGNRGAMQLFWWITTEKHGFEAATVREFFSRIVYGSQTEGEQVLFQKLRVKLSANNDAAVQTFWLIRAWNAWVQGEAITKLQEPKGGFADPFPKIRRPRG